MQRSLPSFDKKSTNLLLSEAMAVIALAHLYPCSSASEDCSFSKAHCGKLYLSDSEIIQQKLNGVSSLMSHKVRTDKLNLLATTNNIVCNDSSLRDFGHLQVMIRNDESQVMILSNVLNILTCNYYLMVNLLHENTYFFMVISCINTFLLQP